jgi:hypothetical protein
MVTPAAISLLPLSLQLGVSLLMRFERDCERFLDGSAAWISAYFAAVPLLPASRGIPVKRRRQIEVGL